jgi:hypothetical protein
MRGWTALGLPVELTGDQENAVLLLLAWDRGAHIQLKTWGRGSGKSTVLATAARYGRARARGRPLRGDPLREEGRSR